MSVALAEGFAYGYLALPLMNECLRTVKGLTYSYYEIRYLK